MTPPSPPAPRQASDSCDVGVIGAGAAGLFAAIFAGRTALAAGAPLRIVALDGARTLGAKILVAGGGRCNVTHHRVDETAYAGSSRNAIRNVLRRFTVEDTVRFFRERGVELKREPTGKLFPTTDRARTVLDAILSAAHDAGVQLRHPWRVESISRDSDGFTITSTAGDRLHARRIILATGGRSLPKTGSDGHGHTLARSLGHSLTPSIFPALVPLTLPADHFLCSLSGITVEATLDLRSGTGKKLIAFTNSTLFTHFGLSGPSVLDISRYYLDAAAHARQSSAPAPRLLLNLLPSHTTESIDAALQNIRSLSPARFLAGPPQNLPDRLARALCEHAGVDPSAPGHTMTRERRRALAAAATALPLPITGDRGFAHAEVTAGGVPLAEVHLDTMESRLTPGLHLCGELLDVDGRIGGFNFQWAWASGFAAGVGAARRLTADTDPAAAPERMKS